MQAAPIVFASLALLSLALPLPFHDHDEAMPDLRAGRIDAACNIISGTGFTSTRLTNPDGSANGCRLTWTPAPATNYTLTATAEGYGYAIVGTYTSTTTDITTSNPGCGDPDCPAPVSFILAAP